MKKEALHYVPPPAPRPSWQLQDSPSVAERTPSVIQPQRCLHQSFSFHEKSRASKKCWPSPSFTMPRLHPTLVNCYTPLSISTDKLESQSQSERTDKERPDGRATYGLRAWHFSPPGLIEWGYTKVFCHATVATSINEAVDMDAGVLKCEVRHRPQPPSPSSAQLQMEKELATQLWTALHAALPLQAFPKHIIQLQCSILQNDGGVLPACIVAATLALIHAGVDVYDLVTSCTVAIASREKGGGDDKNPSLIFLADPTQRELETAYAVVTLATMPSWKQVTLWEQTTTRHGPTSDIKSAAVANQALSLCRDGCRTLHQLMSQYCRTMAESNQ